MAPVLTWMDAVVVMVGTQHRPGHVPHEQWSLQSAPGAGIAPLLPARTLSSQAAGSVRAFGPDRDSEAGSGVSHMPLMVAVHLAHRSTVRPAVYGFFFSPMAPLGLPSDPVLGTAPFHRREAEAQRKERCVPHFRGRILAPHSSFQGRGLFLFLPTPCCLSLGSEAVCMLVVGGGWWGWEKHSLCPGSG